MGLIDTPTITENGSTQSHIAVEPVGDNKKPLASSNRALEPEATKKRRSSILPIGFCSWGSQVTILKMTRHQKRKIDETHVEVGHEELDAASLREHEEFTKVKNILTIELGRYETETWCFPPFPPEYNDSLKLYFCEFCLNFMKCKEKLQSHMVSFASM
ncbi:hypothetical protein F3Y22_tig00001644pilonHSYRG00005 [Hibiscus syriacus]|uniref:Histone acetyltransferase n=1 Tax=Hibiscus syriacus TaxID=106335 RepID=A0A6A3D0H2_HIBSY|nr:hypothetical protein F3Y22_tig00001644pilonHSYRG00005 [Hibiscus syriacus]